MHKFPWRKPNLNQIVVTDICKGSSTNSKQADEKFLRGGRENSELSLTMHNYPNSCITFYGVNQI